MGRTGLDRRDLAAIAIGGVLGAALRWALTADEGPPADGGWFAYAPNTSVALESPGWPTGVLVANLAGTFVLGAIMTWRRAAPARRRFWLGAGAGFCGSLTTFSTFAVDVAWRLGAPWQRGHAIIDPQTDDFSLQPIPEAALYLIVSVVGGCAAFAAGRWLARTTSLREAP